MEELGLTDEEMIRLVAPTQLTQRTLVAPDPEEEPRRIAAFIGMVILYMSIIVFGKLVAMGTVEEKQNRVVEVVILPSFLVLPGFFIAVRAIENPDLLVVRLASLFPPWAPMVMPVRSAVGNAPFWEVALSVVLVLAAIYLLVRIGARVYTGALLRTGGKVKLREAWKATRN